MINNFENKIIEKFPVLNNKELIKAIVKVGTHREVKPTTEVLKKGDFIKSIPLLLKGSIKIMREDDDGDEILMFYLNSGDSCAMSFICCMLDEKSNIRAVAEEESELILIPTKFMDQWMGEYAVWRKFVMLTYKERFADLLNTIDNIAFRKLDDRLLEYLETKSEIKGTKKIRITHQQIAYDLHSSREVISRLLKKLEKMNSIKLSRNEIQLV